MKTITMKMWVRPAISADYEDRNTNSIDGLTYNMYGFKTPDAIAECEVTFKLPDGFDPVSQAVKELEAKRKTLRAQFQMAVNEINDRISKLSALTNEVEA